MVPSNKYNVDTTVNYGGASVALTKNVRNNLYTLNQETDLSICYSNYNSDALTHIDANLSPYNTEYDTSNSYGTITEASYSRTLKDWIRSAPTENIFAGFALYYDVDGTDKSTFWGYGQSSVQGTADGRFVHDIEYNKLVFPMGNITVYDKSVYDNIDYDTYPTNQYGAASNPSSHNISLSTLDANPENYYVSDFSFNNAYIFQPDNNAWVSTAIRPVLLINGENAGGVVAYKNPFLGFYNSTVGTTTTNPNNNPSAGGGGETPKVYNKLSTGYSIGFTNNFAIRQTKFANIQDAFTWGKAKYQSIYGSSSGTHNLYFEHQEIDLGDAVMCLQWFIEIKYVGWWVPPYVNCNMQLYLKGDFVNRYLAGTGLYWSIDGSNPQGLTPTTLHTSNNIWLGAMNDNGTTSGTWIKGADIYTYSGYNKTGNTANENYTPSSGGGGNGDELTDMLSRGQFYGSGLTKYYVDVPAAKLQKALGDWDNIATGKDVLQNLLSYKILCFPSTTFSNGITAPFVIAGTELKDENNNTITAKTLTSTGAVDLPVITITPTFNDFRDYAPYTKIQMFIPLCGWFDLPPWCMGRKISGEMYINPYSGTVRCLVRADGNVVAELGGNAAIDLPFNATAVGMKSAAVLSNLIQTAGAVGRAVMLPTVNTLAGAGSAALGSICAMNANYTESKGTMGDGSNVYGLYNVYIKITRPATVDNSGNSLISIPTQYCHDYGRPCNKQLTLTAGDGYTQIMDANITGAMTDREKQMIIDGFRHGLIL